MTGELSANDLDTGVADNDLSQKRNAIVPCVLLNI